jgi:hypothetical protein
MCEYAIHTQQKHNWFGEKKYRLATFFDLCWDEYCKNPKHFIQPEQYKAVQAIRSCRTAALGVDIYSCPQCGDTTEVYHNCKNRFCPTCSWSDTVRWAEKVKVNMLNIPHRHVVFTIPHQLNYLINKNKFLLLNTLMQTSAEALKDWMNYKYDITGWTNFHKHIVASRYFCDLDRFIWFYLWKWAKRRHAKKGYYWIAGQPGYL